MANTYKDIVITPNKGSSTDDPKIVFSGGNTSVNTDITLRVYPDSNGTLSFEGSAGQLFSVTNDLTGSLFTVNDVSGIPSIEVDALGNVDLAPFGGNVGIGTSNPVFKLDVQGDARITGNLTLGDATTDTITVNAANFNLANNVSFDSGTLFIDKNNDRVGIGTTSPTSKLDINGSIAITAAGARIVGDFVGGTVANRVLFQSSSANTNTSVGAIPNGTGTAASFTSINNSDPTNSAYFAMTAGSTDARIRSDIIGAGAYIPITLWTGGSERMRIDNSGNVSIGTTSTSARLQVVGASSSANVLYLNVGGNYLRAGGISSGSISLVGFENNVLIGNEFSGGDLVLVAGANERMRIRSGGSVGIGTSSPSESLHVAGGVIRIGSDASAGYLNIKRDNSTGYFIYDAAQASPFRGHIWQLGGSETMRIDANGNIGIGTTSPGNKLSIGSTASTSTATPDTIDLGGTFRNTAGGAPKIRVWTDGTNHFGIGVSSGQMEFTTTQGAAGQVWYTAGTEKMRLLAGGNLGIGTASPAYKLEVSGTAHFTGKITSGVTAGTDAIDLAASDGYASLRVARNNGSSSNDGMFIGYGNAGTGTTKIYGGGATSGALEKFSTYTLEPGSFRSPIFYDSNNTAYYVDPGSNSKLFGYLTLNHTLGSTNLEDNTGLVINNNYTDGRYSHRFRKWDDGGGVPLYVQKTSGTANVWSSIAKFGSYTSDASEFAVYGYGYATASWRAPIFYDSDNTGYYVDPTGATSAVLASNVAIGTTSTETSRLRVVATAGVTPLSVSGAASAGIYIDYLGGGSNYYDATTHHFRSAPGTTTFSFLNSDYFSHYSDIRTPIFYDSDNTNYYLKPSGLTNIDRMRINSANTGVVLSVGDSGLDNASTYGMVNLTRAADTVRAHLAFIRTGNYVWQTGYLSGTNSLGFFPWNFSGSQGTPALYMDTSSIVYAPTEFRTPIIYDSNDTATYLNPSGTSVLGSVIMSNMRPVTDGWHTTNDSRNRFYFASNGRTFFGSQNGYEFRSSTDTNIGSIDNSGNMIIAGNIRVNAIVENSNTITSNYTITAGYNAMTAGPISINSGVTVTVPSGSTWTIV